jgi:membrane-associated protease RseP (regulator of RpoE activity)
VGWLGVRAHVLAAPSQRQNPVAAVGGAAEDFGFLVKGTVSSMARVFSPSGISSFAHQVARGPSADSGQGGANAPAGGGDANDDGRLVSIVGAVRLGAGLLDTGVADFLRFLAVLNVFIGLFNLVPLLPLDGGHVAIAVYERAREIGRGGRRYFADVTKLLPVAYAVVLVLVVIGISSLYLDVVNPIQVP